MFRVLIPIVICVFGSGANAIVIRRGQVGTIFSGSGEAAVDPRT